MENTALIEDAMYDQNDLKDVKEVSKNLVSGDFERQYTNRMMEKPGRGKPVLLVLTVTVAVLAAWLVVLTVVQAAQLIRLRNEVDELTAKMIVSNANVKSINQKIANNRLFNEFKALDDAIYADGDEDEVVRDSANKHQGSVEKLGDLTVLEDDSNMDDEDMYEDDDEESGDWYTDYDTRRTKMGSTNMVHLKPDDFTDSVLMFAKENTPLSNIRELKRLLNKDPENPDIGFPSMSSVTEKESLEKQESRIKRSVFPDADAVDQFAAPRTISKTEERRKTKKYSPAPPAPAPAPAQSKMTLHAVTRTTRSDDEGTRRPFIAAHFHGNTSHLSTEIHEHYKGNGLVRVSHDAAHDVWYPSPWTIASPHPRPTLTRNGHIHVHHTGVYLVYVQIYYLDSHDIISWVLHRTNADIEGRETLLQCAQSSHSIERMDKPNSCFSAAALFLKAGDRLAVRNTGGDRHSLMQSEKSFIGLVKLADAEDPDEEF